MTPAGNQLFEVDVNGERLDQEYAKVFHRIVAMLLFACKCICPDIQATFAFLLFTRNHKVGPRWVEKLGRVLSYLKGTKDLNKLHLSLNVGVPVIVVDGCSIYCLHGHEEPHRCNVVFRKRNCIWKIFKTTYQH